MKSANHIDKPEPCAMVIFGASGDLTSRKLFPALYNLAKEHLLPDEFSVVGTAVTEMSHNTFRRKMKEAVEGSADGGPVDSAVWAQFARNIYYVRGNFRSKESYKKLTVLLSQVDRERGTCCNRVYYLATPPSLFTDILGGLASAGLAKPSHGWARIVIEKPFGRDLESARALNRALGEVFHESQIYRIDHYLGKETVQNVLVFRFSSGIFEPIWNRRYVDHVQITMAESLGVEHRAKYYEEAGALRDMVQSHMLQLLALMAMEPPIAFEASAVRNEKLKVLQSVRPFSPEDVVRLAVRGQYGEGRVQGTKVKAYRSEPGVKPDSNRETFAALKLFIDNWRWADVPFYLRTGKRLAEHLTEVSLHFKQPPFPLFGGAAASGVTTNVLVIRIQPHEGISLQFSAKVPGMAVQIQPVSMDFSYADSFNAKSVGAYERLLHDSLLGDATLFARSDSVEAAWALITPILEAWEATPEPSFPNYAAGTWGPKTSEELIAKDGRSWTQEP